MDTFIERVDELSTLIDTQAGILYNKLFDLPVHDLNLPEIPLNYYLDRHHQRKFFSVQTAAELLYRAIKMKGKAPSELTVMEYGAGLGSLFLLAKMIGCRQVVYNDILPDMVTAARIISRYLNIPVDVFIAGGHQETIRQLKEQQVSCDIILSRNVIEHIYDLDDFYMEMATGQPGALIYFSTTANPCNPAMVWIHKRKHRRAEQLFLPMRKDRIRAYAGDLPEAAVDSLATATRGLAMHDFERALQQYREQRVLPDPSVHYTNSCNPDDGNWAEHLLPLSDYKKIIESKGYKLTVLPAFWDTHYDSVLKRLAGSSLNVLTAALGRKGGLKASPFIYIIAEKK